MRELDGIKATQGIRKIEEQQDRANPIRIVVTSDWETKERTEEAI